MIKPGVDIAGLQPPMVLAYCIAAREYHQYGYECVITSALDGQHSRGSLHYVGLALDLRTRHVPDDEIDDLVEGIRGSLGSQYDVVLEPDHLHIEYQPK